MAVHSVETGSGLADPILLDKIDKLFACNVGEYIYLPQLVVVGDQSSGKSSVLEGLTALPFPRDSGLCTRFATQITFRRSEEKRITVSIIPARDAGADHTEVARNWVKKDLQTLDSFTFTEIISEVCECQLQFVQPVLILYRHNW
jgi:Dynamin family